MVHMLKILKKILQVYKFKIFNFRQQWYKCKLLILIALNFKKDDEILVPSFCYISPIHMLKVLGLVPVPVDIELDNLQIDTDQIEKN